MCDNCTVDLTVKEADFKELKPIIEKKINNNIIFLCLVISSPQLTQSLNVNLCDLYLYFTILCDFYNI